MLPASRRPFARAATVAVLVALVAATLTVPFTAPARAAAASSAASAAQERARAIVSAARYQRELPKPNEPPDLPPWLLAVLEWLADASNLLILGGALVVIVLICFAVVRWLEFRRTSLPDAPATAGAAAGEAQADLADAERLAAAGYYTEAVHLLLLAAIEHVFARTGRRPPRAATSRELVRHLPAGTTRAAFAAIVGLVERSLFGGRELTRADWDAGRAQWDALAGSA